MEIKITEDERVFLKESLAWAREGYVEKAQKYMSGKMPIAGYYDNVYLPKLEMFSALQSKLNKEKR